MVEIGDWIDTYLDNKNNKTSIVQYGPEDANMELLDISKLNNQAYILSTDMKGNVNWHNITNVTRHDPSEYIYNIRTKWGREVSVVASKSLLIWNEEIKEFEVKNSEDVKIGDKVPTTFNSPEFNTITHVDLCNYLSKDKYLYGTEYNKITKHKKKKSFEIKDNHVYLKCAKQNSTPLADKFELNRENGFFIGIYLAEGNTCKDYIGIANNDPYLRSIVERWFENNNITHRTQVKAFNENCPGLSTSVRGYSSILVQFLEEFLGKYSNGKYIPNEAFSAPDEFIKGLIDGYISGDGCITDYHVVVSSVSKSLITGVSQLLTRFGIFSKISTLQEKEKKKIKLENIQRRYTLSIQSKYVYKFGETFSLSHKEKHEKLQKLIQRTTLDNMSFLYEEQNNVMLDKIISIEKIESSSDIKYNKVYDITVPDTLNFQIFNGLQVNDTSETGYIQRRLVKAMEDCKVYYDQTVRNATGALVQYLYGEDGIEGTKVENQRISYIDMNIVEIEAVHHLRKTDPTELFMNAEALATMTPETFERLTAHYDALVEDRIYLITKIFKNEKQGKISYAIPFDRIIKTSMERLKLCGPIINQTDLTPDYILDNIEKLITKLVILRKDQGIKFLHILLRYNLSPKPLIFDIHMNKQIFDWVITEIERFFINALAQAGEMVGIVAAQSIGELGTQATLDSFHSSGTAAAVQATSGVPRLKELLSVSKNIKTPTLLIYMKPDISQVVEPVEADEDGDAEKKQDPRIQEAKERSIKVKQILEITRLCDILDGTEIYWDPPGESGLNTGLENDIGIMDIYKAFSRADTANYSDNPWVLRLKLNKEKLRSIGLTMIDVYLRIYNSYSQNIKCVFSDDNAPELIFRIRMTKDAVKDISQDDAISALKAMEHNIVNNIILKGVKGIKKVSMRAKKRNVYNSEKDLFENITEWVLDTDGTNLQKILANPNVDPVRTYSNDIYEIYEILGIEAARNALYREFMEVVGEGSINYRHMSLLLDTMTNRGNLMSVDRHGINRGDVGPLAKSSFEETTDMLINASVFSEYDHINGVSANIMLGQLPPCGTGDHEIMLDEDHYIKLMKTFGKNQKNKIPTIFEDGDGDQQVFAEGCSIESLAFNYEMPEKRTHTELPTQSVVFV